MSTKDQAREKLLNSMRKTKAVINDQPDSKQAHAETYAAPATKAAANRKTAPARANKPEPAPVAHRASSHDPYQSAGRIWPD